MSWVGDHVDDIISIGGEHIGLALVPVVAGLVISLPLGWAAHNWRIARAILVPVSGLLYTIPSLALFVVMPLIIGTRILDPVNVQVALSIYTTALLVRSIADALDAVPADTIAAANAVGFGQARRFFQVDLPLSIPVMVAGVRVAAVSNISLVSVGAIIGVGGLGAFLTEGFQRTNYEEIWAGIIAIVILALVVDALLALLGRYLTPWVRATRARGKASAA